MLACAMCQYSIVNTQPFKPIFCKKIHAQINFEEKMSQFECPLKQKEGNQDAR